MSLQTLKKQYIETLYKDGALLINKTKFKLHHGGESHIYLNHSIFLTKYKNLNLLSKIYIELVPKDLSNYKLGVVDSLMSPIIGGLLTGMLEKDIVITKERKTEHGLENNTYGSIEGEIILVDDVTSTGSILINAAKTVKEQGGSVRYAILSACRNLSAIEYLHKAGIKALYIATYEEVIQTLWSTLSSEEQEMLIEENKDKKYDWNLPHL